LPRLLRFAAIASYFAGHVCRVAYVTAAGVAVRAAALIRAIMLLIRAIAYDIIFTLITPYFIVFQRYVTMLMAFIIIDTLLKSDVI